MRFHRWPRREYRGVTNRRLAHARKAIEKEKDKLGLFAHEQAITDPVERVEHIDRALAEAEQETRTRRAAEWRAVRHRLSQVPEPLRSKLLAYWNDPTRWIPANPYNLQSLITDSERGRFDPDKRNAEIERCRLLGQLTRDIEGILQLPILPTMKPGDISLLRLHCGREIAQARSPHLFPEEPSDLKEVHPLYFPDRHGNQPIRVLRTPLEIPAHPDLPPQLTLPL